MDEKRLLEEIDKKKNLQADKYLNCIKEIIKNHPDYYKNKDYAKKIMEEKETS